MTKIGAIAVIVTLILLIVGDFVGILACALDIPGDEKPHGKK